MPLALAAVLALPAVPASAGAVDAAVNGSRSSALPSRSDLDAAAAGAASRMAARGALEHMSLAGLTSICSAAGEIVGAGTSVGLIFDLFMKSDQHRPLLLSSAWTAMGTAAVTGGDGKIYVSVVFCTELHPPSAPPPGGGSAVTPPPNRTVSVSGSAPVAAAPPPMVSFHEVFFRLVTGDLTELWSSFMFTSSHAPSLGPAPFIPLAWWSVPIDPALS
jgi:hypothetical protein